MTRALSANSVHLWTIDQQAVSVAQFQKMQQTLSEAERVKVARFKFESLRQAAVISRGSLRIILSKFLTIPPETIQFIYNAQDKPALAPPAEYAFNVAHSGNFVLIAVSKTAVGVDIEQMKQEHEYEMIARRYFSEWETAVFQDLPAADQPQAFYNCWTRKEAYLKGIGTGLTTKLDSFDVEFRSGREPTLLETRHSPVNVEKWQLIEVKTAVNYTAALAVKTHQKIDITHHSQL